MPVYLGIANEQKTPTTMITAANSAMIYDNTMTALRMQIDGYVCKESYAKDAAGNYITGISPFCRKFGFDRVNVNKILNGQREMSVGLYQRIAVALGFLPQSACLQEAVLQNLSLKTFLLIDSNSIKDSMMLVNMA